MDGHIAYGESSDAHTIVSLGVRSELLVCCEGLRAPRMITLVRLGPGWRMYRADMFSELVMLGECSVAVGLGTLQTASSLGWSTMHAMKTYLESLLASVHLHMYAKMLRGPEPLLTARLLAEIWFGRTRKMRTRMRLQVAFP